MRKAFVEYLRCPLTGEKLFLRGDEENAQEVRQGELRNESGTQRYQIIEGVAELLPMSELDRDTLREREVRDQKRRDWEVELSAVVTAGHWLIGLSMVMVARKQPV